MGQNQANPFHQSNLANEYQIQHREPELFLTFLKRKSNSQEYLLRQQTFNELREFSSLLERLQKRKKITHANLTNLETVEERAEDQMCSSFYKIYALWQYPKKTLLDDIATRTLENRPFQPKELGDLLASCLPPLALLQQNGISHECLSSKAVRFEESGNVKVADPMSAGMTTNLELVLSNRYSTTIYLSPQQCESIASHRPIAQKNAYKNDVFTFALVLLEAALLERQDKCYQEDCSVVNYAVLAKNIARFGERYGPELQRIVEIMTDRNIQTRPDWISLQNIHKQLRSRSIGNVPSNQSLNVRNQQINTSIVAREQPTVIVMPPEPNFQRIFQGMPLSTIPSVSNEGSSSMRQDTSRLPSNQAQLYSNISSIPPYSFVSPIAASSNTTHFNQLERSQKVTSNAQSFNPSPSVANPSFLPSNSSPLHANSVIQPAMPVNIRFASQLPVTVPLAKDMTATFGSNIQQLPQPIQPLERFTLSQSPLPGREAERVQAPPLSYAVEGQEGVRRQTSDPKLVGEGEAVEVEETFAKGSRYTGFKVKGMRHGQGTFHYQDGGRYEGEWRFNRMNGFGRLFYQSNRLAYEGEWLNDQFHGRGKLFNEAPQPLAGGFDYRSFDEIDEFWEYYEGQFEEDLKNGSGKLRFSSGELFEGSFADDMVQGEGVFFCRDGQRVHGVWLQNRLVQVLS